MAALTVTSAGLTLKSFQELRDELKQAWISRFGEAIDLSATSVDGHHIDIECKAITSISQLIEAVVSNFNVETAEGVWLDILADYRGIERIKATYSKANVTFYGVSGTSVPAGTKVKYDGSVCDFSLESSLVIASDGKVSGVCVASAKGSVEVYVGDWAMVSSTPVGVTCKVLTAGGVGNEDETDAELRKRIISYKGEGLCTYDKMLGYLQSRFGESNVTLTVNEEDKEVAGIEAKSFEFCIKNGIGENDDIAQAIWECKAAGIKASGNSGGVATDVVGLKHNVKFSRPSYQKLWVFIRIKEYTEEVLPDNYADAISEAVVEWGETEFVAGKDVIPQRFLRPIYSVDGILNAEVLVCISETEPTSTSQYSSSVIPVAGRSQATIQKVSVELV